uniref:Kallikrein-4 n=1 Tax=Jaculus jaculus TaxID=51337 RepID=A0A8C5KQM3_JACJA
MTVTVGTPWGWFLGNFILGVTGSLASSLSSRIVQGEDCMPHSQPWQAALFAEDGFFCSGVLVHPRWVLSAAHCSQDSYMVGLGLHSLEATQEPGSRMIEASISIPHPQYNDPPYANDLMLIKLDQFVMESDTVKSISIASQCPIPGDSCLVSGWGRMGNGRLPSLLQCVNLSVAPEETCRELYGPVYHQSMFCAGGQDQKDSCHGDSGGPIVCNRSLQGLVSLGQGECGQPGIPSVYTNLCKFTDWIQRIILTR